MVVPTGLKVTRLIYPLEIKAKLLSHINIVFVGPHLWLQVHLIKISTTQTTINMKKMNANQMEV